MAAYRLNTKLSKCFFGPFRVIAKVGAIAYTLQLPSTSHIHPTIHVSQLKLFTGPLPQQILALPNLSVHNRPLLLLVSILATCIHIVRGQTIKQVLVQWSHSPTEDATWDFHVFCKLYKQLDLEDKVQFKGGKSDSNLSTGLNIGLGSKELKKVLQDWVVRGLVSQEEAQVQEDQERLLEAQEEEA